MSGIFASGVCKRHLSEWGHRKQLGGIDGIPSRVITQLRNSKAFVDVLYGLFVMYIHVGYWPEEWNEILLAAVHKPGKPPNMRTSYRAVHLISGLAKVFASVVEGRLTEWVERSDEQFGFEKGHGARDNVLVAAAIFEKYSSSGLHCCFVDFKAAFDTVDREKLIKKLKELNVNARFVELIARMYSNVAARVKGSDVRFVENRGVKQGDPLGPRLFNIFIRDLPAALHEEGGTDPVNLANRIIRCLLYADDLLVVSTTVEGLQRQLDALASYCKEWGLVVNTVKTEYMFAKGRQKGEGTPARQMVAPVSFEGKQLVVCTEFKYVGVWFSDDCTFERHFEKALDRARSAMYACDGRALRLDKACPVALRCMMLRVYVYPLLMYCCESLPVTDKYKRLANRLIYDYAVRVTGVGVR